MKVVVNSDTVNLRTGPDKKYPTNGQVHRGDEFTIVDVKNEHGLLKSRAGWINLKFCIKKEENE